MSNGCNAHPVVTSFRQPLQRGFGTPHRMVRDMVVEIASMHSGQQCAHDAGGLGGGGGGGGGGGLGFIGGGVVPTRAPIGCSAFHKIVLW